MNVDDLSFRCPRCDAISTSFRPPDDRRAADVTIGELPPDATLLITCGSCGERVMARVESPAT